MSLETIGSIRLFFPVCINFLIKMMSAWPEGIRFSLKKKIPVVSSIITITKVLLVKDFNSFHWHFNLITSSTAHMWYGLPRASAAAMTKTPGIVTQHMCVYLLLKPGYADCFFSWKHASAYIN